MDTSDIEWRIFRKSICNILLTFLVHSVFFHFVTRRLDRSSSSFVLIFVWLIIHINWTSVSCVLVIASHALLTISITYYFKNVLIAYISCVFMATTVEYWAPFSNHLNGYFGEGQLYMYKAVQVLNICIHMQTSRPNTNYFVVDYLEYLLYPPYSTVLIVLFEDFNLQMTILKTKNHQKTTMLKPSSSLCLMAIRLTFWFFFIESTLHFSRANALFSSHYKVLKSFSYYQKLFAAKVVGQLFHVKYVLMFGVPRFFAILDGMSPPGAPICPGRVSRFSQLWRYFDQGLHKFLKQQIFMPLIRLFEILDIQSNVFARLTAIFTVFLFVLAWHGLDSSSYLCWVCLNTLGVSLEYLGCNIIRRTMWWHLIQKKVGPANSWRLEALAQLLAVTPGLFGIFFFLGGEGVGTDMFFGVLCQGVKEFMQPWKLKWGSAGCVLFHMLATSYCSINVGMFLECKLNPWVDKKDVKKKL